MESFLGLLRLALEHGWKLGALVAIFFGAILIGPDWGLPVPVVLREWCGAGLIFGVAVVTVSIVSHVEHAVLAWRRNRAERNYDTKEALVNLSALNREELAILQELLRGPHRFEVSIKSPAYSMLQKGVLKPVRFLSGGFLCEVHPAISDRREAIESRLRVILPH